MSEWDDQRVEDAFARLYQSTTATIVTPEIEEIVQRAQRHRTTNVVVMLTVMVAVLGVIAVTGLVRRDAPLTPAEPTPSEPVVDGRVDSAKTILPGFLDSRLLRETALDSGESPSAPGCVAAAADEVTISRVVGDSDARVAVTLAIYGSEDDAAATFASCSTPVAPPEPEQWPTFGDESAGLTYLIGEGSGELAGQPARMVTVRVGRAVEIFTSAPYRHPTANVGVKAADLPTMQSVVADALPRLCLFTAVGCTPQSGMPVPLDHLTRNQEVYLLALRVYAADDLAARPGTALAVAASAGYHPDIVRQGCDAGADFAQADLAERTRYLALYFQQRNEADEAAAELLLRDAAIGPYLQVTPVQTRCVS